MPGRILREAADGNAQGSGWMFGRKPSRCRVVSTLFVLGHVPSICVPTLHGPSDGMSGSRDLAHQAHQACSAPGRQLPVCAHRLIRISTASASQSVPDRRVPNLEQKIRSRLATSSSAPHFAHAEKRNEETNKCIRQPAIFGFAPHHRSNRTGRQHLVRRWRERQR